jgi:MFS family permease
VKARVLPLFVAMFVANYIDRVNVGFVRTHLEADLGIGAAAFGLGAGLFFVGYAVFEVPSNLLLQRYGARVWLTRIMLSWGVVAMAMAFVRGAADYYALRFLLGVAEAGFFPGVVYYFTQWLPARERGKAMALFLSGSAIASILSGPLSGALLRLQGLGLRGWQWMFLVEGLASVALAGVVWARLDSLPRDARWLAPEQRAALEAAIALEQRQREAGRTATPPLRALVADPQIPLFCFVYFSVALTIYAATFWLPTLIRRMGTLDDLEVGLLNSVPWLISVVAMYAYAAAAARWPRQQAWAASAFVVAALGMYVATTGGPLLAYAGICLAAVGFKASSSLFWPIPQAYLDARVSAAVIALVNSVGNLGGFVAPATFGLLEERTGGVTGGLLGLSAVALVAAVAVLFTRSERRTA